MPSVMAAARARNTGRRLARSLRRACWPLDGTDTCAAACSASLASCPGLGSPAGTGFCSTNASRWSHSLQAARHDGGQTAVSLVTRMTLCRWGNLHGPNTGLLHSARHEALLSAGDALHLKRRAPGQSASVRGLYLSCEWEPTAAAFTDWRRRGSKVMVSPSPPAKQEDCGSACSQAAS